MLLVVNSAYGLTKLFVFITEEENDDTPLLVWLQGGPGGSSMFGLFVENGPLVVDEKLNVHVRTNSWASKYNLLFIDNPVGAGFSFTTTPDGYV
jgi:vitellogenic carboxypeptidase-like protein